jgi:hypothetical protein
VRDLAASAPQLLEPPTAPGSRPADAAASAGHNGNFVLKPHGEFLHSIFLWLPYLLGGCSGGSIRLSNFSEGLHQLGANQMAVKSKRRGIKFPFCRRLMAEKNHGRWLLRPPAPFTFAGLWENWKIPNLESGCALARLSQASLMSSSRRSIPVCR